jgi:hypothetical protein
MLELMKTEEGRERGTGKYTWTVERSCVCGHALGEHTAARVKTPEGVRQDCLTCACRCFKPAKAAK